MKHKVIFDTNSVRSAESFSDFLGGRSDLDRFTNLAQIIIPDLVIDEIKCQKRKHLKSKRDSFLSNPFHHLLGLKAADTEAFDMEDWISQLPTSENIPFISISLTKNKEQVLEQMKQMCLNCEAPFEETSDKGFKDTYIYYTILEYLNESKDEQIFVVTQDDRLAKALRRHSNIRVVKDFDEFEKYNSEYFKDEYFIGRLKEEIDSSIEASGIVNISLNIEENWILRITCDDKLFLVEVDFRSKEILGFSDEDYVDDVNGLVSSSSFSTTHAYVASLTEKINYLADQDILKLLTAAIHNDQISWIAEDEDVKNFFGTLYKSKSNLLSKEDRIKFEEHYKHYE